MFPDKGKKEDLPLFDNQKPKQVHRNSIRAYNELNLTPRQKEVLEALKVLEEATDQEIADKMGYTINRVTGRITELQNKGVVFEAYTRIGNMGKLVRVNKIKTAGCGQGGFPRESKNAKEQSTANRLL